MDNSVLILRNTAMKSFHSLMLNFSSVVREFLMKQIPPKNQKNPVLKMVVMETMMIGKMLVNILIIVMILRSVLTYTVMDMHVHKYMI